MSVLRDCCVWSVVSVAEGENGRDPMLVQMASISAVFDIIPLLRRRVPTPDLVVTVVHICADAITPCRGIGTVVWGLWSLYLVKRTGFHIGANRSTLFPQART